jgi:hypothetical protein
MPAATPIALIVCDIDTAIGAEYTRDDVVGVDPSVV